jgi:hypothetical protein
MESERLMRLDLAKPMVLDSDLAKVRVSGLALVSALKRASELESESTEVR